MSEIENGEEKVNERNKKTITLTEDELKQMINEGISSFVSSQPKIDLRAETGWQEVKEEKAKKTARMKLYQEDTNSPFGLVVDWKFLKFEYDEETRKRDKPMYEVTVKFDDKEKKIVMALGDFIDINTYETVEILETDSKKVAKSFGKVRQTLQDGGYYRSPFPGANGSVNRPLQGEFVDQNVEKIVAFHKIKRENGEILTINNDRLNP